MGHDIYESDSTCYDLPREMMDMPDEPIEPSTTLQIVNRRITQHPVWSGSLVGIVVAFCCFIGAMFLNNHDQHIRQPGADALQDLKIDTIQTEQVKMGAVIVDISKEQIQQRIIIERIAIRLDVDVPEGD